MSDKARSILIGAALAGAGAFVGFFADAASDGQFGGFSALIGAASSVILNVIRKYAEPPAAAKATAAAVLIVLLLLSGYASAQCPGGVCPVQRVFPGAVKPHPIPEPMQGPPTTFAVRAGSEPVGSPPSSKFRWADWPGVGWGWVDESLLKPQKSTLVP